jgi:predicted RNA-binding Zn-ribbon protein involved in translation (DUF1610 family)
MTIAKAIQQLVAIQAKHGDTVEVFFDCPQCGRVTAPDLVAVVREQTRAVLTQGAE